MTAVDDRVTGIFENLEVPEGFRAELLTEPTRASASGLPDCTVERTTKFGEPVPLDLPGITLDTSEFKTYSGPGRAVKSINSSTRPRSSGSRSL
ncbi:hypothetical protein [Kitasatospora sp. NPDC096204]|uniref:hypothetical protein n=1 Tax=Kitasatospora sp. NPDC096204 TaxID=3364094 RepID=UPI00382F67B0